MTCSGPIAGALEGAEPAVGAIVGKGRRIDDAHPCQESEVRLAGLGQGVFGRAVGSRDRPIRATIPAASTGAAAIVTGCGPAT